MSYAKILTSSSTFLVVVICHTSVFAQQDSLVDFFPLSVGNIWIYNYDHWIEECGATNCTGTSDTGTASYTILARTDFPDSALWTFKELRNIHHFVRDWAGIIKDSTIFDSTLFDLVEVKSSRHQLYRRVPYPGTVWLADSGVLGNSVIPFLSDMPDTGRMYRYHHTDSTRTISFNIKYPALGANLWVTLKQGIGMLFIWVSDGISTGTAGDRHQLMTQTITRVQDDSPTDLPSRISLTQNYPNPFNPSTSISFSIPKQSHVRLQVFNLLGQLITTLADETKPPGTYTATWGAGTRSSGLYFYRMTAGEFVQTKKAILIR